MPSAPAKQAERKRKARAEQDEERKAADAERKRKARAARAASSAGPYKRPALSPEARFKHARRQRERRAQLALERRKHAEASIKYALDLAAELGVKKAREHVRALADTARTDTAQTRGILQERPVQPRAATSTVLSIIGEDPTLQAIFDSWWNRRQVVPQVTRVEFERWRDWNGNGCGVKVDTACCQEAITELLVEKAGTTRVPNRIGGVESISIGDRISSGCKLFAKDRMSKYTPQEGDDMALYFKLLLANLPLHRVEYVWSDSLYRYTLPKNATRMGFHRAHAKRFRQHLGEAPTLWDWQRYVKSFLTQWCPHGKPNMFKWRDNATVSGHWTLTSSEIDRIAYATTFQYAHVLLQYEV